MENPLAQFDDDTDSSDPKWAGQKKAKATGTDEALPEIVVGGERQKVSRRDSAKWNDSGSSAVDDQTFAKLDQEICE